MEPGLYCRAGDAGGDGSYFTVLESDGSGGSRRAPEPFGGEYVFRCFRVRAVSSGGGMGRGGSNAARGYDPKVLLPSSKYLCSKPVSKQSENDEKMNFGPKSRAKLLIFEEKILKIEVGLTLDCAFDSLPQPRMQDKLILFLRTPNQWQSVVEIRIGASRSRSDW